MRNSTAIRSHKKSRFDLFCFGTTDEKHTRLVQTRSESDDGFSSSTTDNRTETWRTDQIGSKLSASSINLSSGLDINITGSDITATNDATLIAGRNLNIFAATNTYGSESYSHESTSGLQINGFNISDKGPEITTKQRTDATQQSFSRSNLGSRSGNLNLVAGNNLIVSGSDLSANAGNLNLIANGTVALLTGQDTLNQSRSTETQTDLNFYTQQTRTVNDSNSSLINTGSTAQGKTINIISSNADIILQAASLKAGDGGINLNAGRDIQLLTASDSTSSSHQETLKTKGFDANYDSTRNKDNKYDKQTQTAQVTSLVSDGKIASHSGRDTRIEASTLNAQGAIDLSAGSDTQTGNITFAAAKDKTFTAVSESGNNLVWQSSSGSGENRETLKLANISAGKGLTVNASGSIKVEIPEVSVEAKQPGLTSAVLPADNSPAAANKTLSDEQRLTDHIQTLAQKPGQAWIGQLASMAQSQPDKVKLQQVNAALKQWNYSNEGLTPEGAVIVALAVTYFTGGAASGAANTVVTAAGATGAAAAAASAALAAGMTTLATQATLAMINNQGDVGKTLNDLGKSESVKTLVASMLTAGVAGSYGKTYDIERLGAQTVTGCATGNMTGSGCETGATTAALMTGSEWINHDMRAAMIDDSKKFTGVTDSNDPSGKNYNNATGGGSAGIDGDGTRLAGTRINENGLKEFGAVKEVTPDNWTFTGTTDKLNPATGQPYTLPEALTAQGGLTGGTQALPPTFAGIPVAPGSFLDKLQESFAGPHDYMGGRIQGGYDSLGNWSANNGLGAEIMSGVNIPLVVPLAIPTFLRQINIDVVTINNVVKNGTQKP